MKIQKRFFENLMIYIMAFAIPIILLTCILVCLEIYPFGNKSLLIWDMHLQYADFFSWLKRVFDGEASLFYSFGKSLGDNSFGLVTYYLSSPFNLLLFLFEDIQLFIMVLTVIKIGCCGLTCAIFCKKRFPDLSETWTVLLAISYALMAYNVTQSSNIMWLDGVIVLPILMLGVYRFVLEEKQILLYVSVIFAIISNWYTAYMCCVFSVFYFSYEMILKEEKLTRNFISKFFGAIIKYCMTLALGVCSAMFLFLPTILNLLQGKGVTNQNIFKPKFRCNPIEIVKALFPEIFIKNSSNILVLFCGTFITICVILFFFSKVIKRREKVYSGIFLIFLIFSASFIPFENVWNGFRRVASYYCRFSFVICFLMIYLAAMFLNTKSKIKIPRIVVIGCCVLTISELGYNAHEVWRSVGGGRIDTYNDYVDEAKKQIKSLNDYDDTAFYRVDQTSSRGTRKNYLGTFNEGMAYGFSPLASYSSTFNKKTVNFIANCGYSDCTRLAMYNEPILLSDSLLGVKYVLSQDAPFGYENVENLATYNGKDVYFNQYATSVGYAVSDSIFKKIKTKNCFEYQNKLLSEILGHNVQCFKKLESEMIISENEITWKVQSPGCENITYGYLTKRRANSVDIYVNDKFRTYYSSWTSYKTFQISNDQNEQMQTVSMRGEINKSKGIKGVFYFLDMEVFKEAMTELRQEQFLPDVFKDGYMKGNYEAKKDGYLMLTVPGDKGWDIRNNGKRIQEREAAGIFITIPVKAGVNQIEMKYSPPGFVAGIFISLFAVTCFSGWIIMNRRRWK